MRKKFKHVYTKKIPKKYIKALKKNRKLNMKK